MITLQVETITFQTIKNLPLQQRLEVAPLIDPRELLYRDATKTKELKARPLAEILADPIGYNKFLLDTMEGTQGLQLGSMLCVGFNDDCWQQKPEKLFAKYEPVNTTPSGWVVYRPKPDNAVEAGEVEADYCSQYGFFSLIGTYGDQVHLPVGYPSKLQQYLTADGVALLQTGKAGDFVLHRPGDFSDNWRVARGFFDATYELTN